VKASSGSDRSASALAATGVHCLEIPTPFSVGSVNCYLIEGDRLTLVDCGPNSATSLHVLERELNARGYALEDLGQIVLTHHHMDHIGLAGVLTERTGAGVACLGAMAPYLENWDAWAARDDDYAAELMERHGLEPHVNEALRSVAMLTRSWGAPASVSVRLADDDVIRCGERDLRVLHRPGHSPSDTILVDEGNRLVFGGDHLLVETSSNALIAHPLTTERWRGPRPQQLVLYRESLVATRQLDVEIVLAGHGPPVNDHRTLIDQRLAEQDARAEALLALLENGPRSAHDLALAFWGRTAITQAFLTLSEVVGHLDLLIREGRAEELDGDTIMYASV
jgi:glyoxylase-like metal-dependent hydrolase (beta-lactamase superfamily II)